MGQGEQKARKRRGMTFSVLIGAATVAMAGLAGPVSADPGNSQGTTNQNEHATANASGVPGNGQGDAQAANHVTEGTAGTSGDVSSPQPTSTADDNGVGANVTGPYDSTRDGSPSGNGNGNGEAVGKPCAGCVGKADNKNPPGQLPGPSDGNAGYECDTNHGIARTNPAHTGCTAPEVVTPPSVCTSNCSPSSVLGEELVRTPATPATVEAAAISRPAAAPSGALAFTGFDAPTLVAIALIALAFGAALQLSTRRRRA